LPFQGADPFPIPGVMACRSGVLIQVKALLQISYSTDPPADSTGTPVDGRSHEMLKRRPRRKRRSRDER